MFHVDAGSPRAYAYGVSLEQRTGGRVAKATQEKAYKVLIVDDDPGTLELMEFVLQIDSRITLFTATEQNTMRHNCS